MADNKSVISGLWKQRSLNVFDRELLWGITALLIGVSQLPLVFLHAWDNIAWVWVNGGAGMCLIGVAEHFLTGNAAFEDGWADIGKGGRFSHFFNVALALVIVAASAYIVATA
jgi:hypothetical protein